MNTLMKNQSLPHHPKDTSQRKALPRLLLGLLGAMLLLWNSSGCLYGTECREDLDCGIGQCFGGKCFIPKGQAKLFATLRHSKPIKRVTLSASSPKHSIKLVQNLSNEEGFWHGLLSEIPSNIKHEFTLKAYDESDALILQQTISDVVMRVGRVGLVGYVLQSKDVVPAFAPLTKLPSILGFWTDEITVAPGGSAKWHIVPKPGQTDVNYFWEGTAGQFSPANQTSTTWLAPREPGRQRIHIMLRNKQNQLTAFTFETSVKEFPGAISDRRLSNRGGEAYTPALINTWPSIVSLKTSLKEIGPKGSIVLTAVAIDREGHLLDYRWDNKNCEGSFTPIRANETKWTAPPNAPNSGVCKLQVDVSDGRGGITQRVVKIAVYE